MTGLRYRCAPILLITCHQARPRRCSRLHLGRFLPLSCIPGLVPASVAATLWRVRDTQVGGTCGGAESTESMSGLSTEYEN